MSFIHLGRQFCAVCLLLILVLTACGSGEESPVSQEEGTAAVTASPELPTVTRPPTATPFIQLTPSPISEIESSETISDTAAPPETPQTESGIFIPTPTPFAISADNPPDIQYNNITFSYQERLDYSRMLPEVVAANPRQPGIGVDRGNPEYTRFVFGSANPSDNFFRPTEAQIRVYDIESYSALFPEINIEIAKLDELLATRPTSTEPNTLPILPLTGLSETFYSQIDYIPFQGGFGQGIRYIAQYDQIAGPIHNSGIFYTYQGITADRQHYVVAFFPIRLDFLPDTFDTADLEPFQTEEGKAAYYEQTVAEINSLTIGDFLPSLDVFDDVIRSLTINAEIIVAQEENTGSDTEEDNPEEAATPVPATPESENVPGVTAEPSDQVFIQGEILYPGGIVPFMRIYAISTDGTKFFFTELLESPTYRIAVEPGTYEVFAYTVEELEAGGYTTYVTCTEPFRGDCGDQLLLPVVVNNNESVSNVNIADWEITDYRFPLPPDSLAERVQSLRAEAAGRVPEEYATINGLIDFPESPIPPIRIYAQNINTGELFNQQLGGIDDQYSISVPPGTYILYGYAFLPTGGVSGGGYTNGDTGLIPLTVSPASSNPNITLGNWNQPPLSFIPSAPGFSNSPNN